MIPRLIIYMENQWSLYKPRCFPLSRKKVSCNRFEWSSDILSAIYSRLLTLRERRFYRIYRASAPTPILKNFYFFTHRRTKGVHANASHRFWKEIPLQAVEKGVRQSGNWRDWFIWRHSSQHGKGAPKKENPRGDQKRFDALHQQGFWSIFSDWNGRRERHLQGHNRWYQKRGRSSDLPPFHSHKWSGRGHLDPGPLNPIEHSSYKNIHMKRISLIFLYSFWL